MVTNECELFFKHLIDNILVLFSRQYSAFEYPALVVFPAAKSESRKYPSEMSINNTNIIGFVLANLSRRHRLLGLVMSCQNGNYKVNKRKPTVMGMLIKLFISSVTTLTIV